MPSSLAPVVVQSLSRVWFYVAPWTAAHQASLPSPSACSAHVHGVSDAIQPSHPLSFHFFLIPTLTFPSIRVFSNESALWIRWPKCWSFSATISLSNECSELVLSRMDWLGLVGSPCSTRDCHEPFQTAQLKSISSWVLRLLFGPTLPSIPDYWKSLCFD